MRWTSVGPFPHPGRVLSTALAGLAAGLSLIVAIGAQNAFVLRQGLRREHVGSVVLICMMSDATLIAAGTLGVGVLVARADWLLVALRWAGAAYLGWFALSAFRSAARPGTMQAQPPRSQGTVVATTFAVTLLNPHVYLDTVVLLGTLANQHGTGLRWAFATGAAAGSVAWFTALGFGARLLAGPLGRPATWRVVDTVIGVVMLAFAVRLVRG